MYIFACVVIYQQQNQYGLIVFYLREEVFVFLIAFRKAVAMSKNLLYSNGSGDRIAP